MLPSGVHLTDTFFIDTATIRGGGDYPESVNDAIVKAMDELNWNSKLLKAVIVIDDAS